MGSTTVTGATTDMSQCLARSLSCRHCGHEIDNGTVRMTVLSVVYLPRRSHTSRGSYFDPILYRRSSRGHRTLEMIALGDRIRFALLWASSFCEPGPHALASLYESGKDVYTFPLSLVSREEKAPPDVIPLEKRLVRPIVARFYGRIKRLEKFNRPAVTRKLQECREGDFTDEKYEICLLCLRPAKLTV